MGRYSGRFVVISGVRDITHADEKVVERKMAEIVADRPLGIIFGGARGVDTLALLSAREAKAGARPATSEVFVPPKLIVIVPASLADQPRHAQIAARACADEIIELRGTPADRSAYKTRNQRMLREAAIRGPDGTPDPILVAFPASGEDKRVVGGTRMTIALAGGLGIEVESAPVRVTPGGED